MLCNNRTDNYGLGANAARLPVLDAVVLQVFVSHTLSYLTAGARSLAGRHGAQRRVPALYLYLYLYLYAPVLDADRT